MLTGLDLTFDLLSRTTNTAAAAVLAPALDSESADLRLRAARALLRRGELAGARRVLLALPRLGDEGWELLKGFESVLAPAAAELLGEPEHEEEALRIIDRLQLTDAAVDVVNLSLTSTSFSMRRDAAQVALSLAAKIGQIGRLRSERYPLRDQLIHRLGEALKSEPQQLSLTLVDAFLSAARWEDGTLKAACESDGTLASVLADRLARSRAPGVIELLARWIERPRIPLLVRKVLQARADKPFLDLFLTVVGADPSPSMTGHFKYLRPMACARLGSLPWREYRAEQLAALVRIVADNEQDELRVVKWILEVIAFDSSASVEQAAVRVFSGLQGLDIELVIRSTLAAIRDEDANEDPEVDAVQRLLKIAEGDGPLAEPARKALRALHVEALLERIDDLQPATCSRLGRVVRKLDPDAPQRVETLLRHSVHRLRMRGIRAAIALQLVDEMPEVWERMFQGLATDHQESRLAAVAALRHGRGENSLHVLQAVAQHCTGAVQEAAARALNERTKEDSLFAGKEKEAAE